MRVLAGLEKATSYYVHNTFFLLLELMPMITLIRWRVRVAHGEQPDTHVAPRLALISKVEAVLVVLMVLAATAMARGYGSA